MKNYGVTLLLESGVEGFAPPQLVKGEASPLPWLPHCTVTRVEIVERTFEQFKQCIDFVYVAS